MKSRSTYLLLALGIALLVLSNGRWIIPVAAWLAPIPFLRLSHTNKPARGLVLILLANVLSYNLAMRGVVSAPGLLYLAICTGYGAIFTVPYLVDGFVARRTSGFLATLAFPLTWTSVEYVNTLTTPYSSWGAIGYTQTDNLPLMQIVSVTGLAGVTFLVAWFASVASWAWRHQLQWTKIRLGVSSYATVLLLVLLAGGARMIFFAPSTDTVRVGLVIRSAQLRAGYAKCADEAGHVDWQCYRPVSDALLDDLYLHTRQAADAGAKIVSWDESPVTVPREDEATAIERGRELAREKKIYLGMTMTTVDHGSPEEPGQNKVVWISPAGDIVTEYLKSKILPGDNDEPGKATPDTFDTPYGRVVSLICFDMDFPQFVRHAARADADIAMVPSNEWREIDPLHTKMATVRGLENGFSVVRITNHGLSAAADYQGRIVATMDSFNSTGRVLVSDIPTRGSTTIYSRIGDLFSWLCLVGLLAVGLVASRIPNRRMRRLVIG